MIERNLLEKGDKEVPSSVVGETIMTALHDLDSVAYVRFASVYRSFQDIDEFVDELEDLLKERRGTSRKRRKRSSAASAKPARTPQSES